MRKLTIIRESMGTYGSYATLKIYIQDYSEEPETTIKGVPCRLLGTIESDEAKTFDIDEREAKVFAVMSKAWRNYKYDYRVIPEGIEDIILSGKSSADRRYGCMFYFDGLELPEVKEDFERYKFRMKVKYLVTLIVMTVIVSFVIYSRYYL